jgi:hypothetical protein
VSDNATRKVRTTLQPDVELEVGPAEYIDLERQGLLVDKNTKTSAAKEASTKKEG